MTNSNDDGWGKPVTSWGNDLVVNSGWQEHVKPSFADPAADAHLKVLITTERMTVVWDDKTHTIDYIPVGDLGVITLSNEPYRIVHIHTKSRFDLAIPHGEWTNEQLINWCEKVQELDQPNIPGHKNDWQLLKLVSDYNDWSNDENVRARGRILDWCRSVKVA